MTGVLYDRIGRGYDTTRRADPSIVALLADALGGTSENVLDLGCGTGNYAIALAERGFRMWGVDPSLAYAWSGCQKAPERQLGCGECGPPAVQRASFGSVIAVNVVHHFKDDNGFGEIRRVLREKGILLIFGGLAEQIRHYWLAHYFPQAIRRSADEAMSLQRLQAIGRTARLELVRRVAWHQPVEPIDFFLYCGKHRPELYLDPRVRAGISTFAKLADRDEMNKGLTRLARDIESGAVRELIAKSELPDGDYSLIVMMAS